MVNIKGWFKAKVLASRWAGQPVIRSCIRCCTEKRLGAQVADPFWSYIKQSAHPRILARSAAIGFCIGVCPLVGEHFSSLACQLPRPPR